jgi:hypothetical protein
MAFAEDAASMRRSARGLVFMVRSWFWGVWEEVSSGNGVEVGSVRFVGFD